MTINLFFCGDVVNSLANQNMIGSSLEEMISLADISICNFEAPVENDGLPIAKAGPHVIQTKEAVGILKEAGFTTLSLANNHIYDYGEAGLKATIEEIQSNGLEYLGAGLDFESAYSPRVIEKNGVKVGIISSAEAEFGCLTENENRGGYAYINHFAIEDNVRLLKASCDLVVCICHAGVEEIDAPLPEWRARYKRLCELGADVIIGHHPHVPQGIEEYGDSLIFYSLGNFYFDTAGFINSSNDSFSVLLKYRKTEKLTYDIVYHKMVNKQTVMQSDREMSFDISQLNSRLRCGYEQYMNNTVVELFRDRYLPYYESALNGFTVNDSVFYKIKRIIKYLFKNKSKNNAMLLLLHNIKIESHRYSTQRALSLLYEKVREKGKS